MNVQNLQFLIDDIKKNNSKPLVLFLGAGISASPPSCCPIWVDMLKNVLDSLSMKYSEFSQLMEFSSSFNHQIRNLKPEIFTQIMYNHLKGEFFPFLDILCFGQPNNNHKDIIKMIPQYKIPIVITTNFDTFIESELNDSEIKYQLHVNSAPKGQKKINSIISNEKNQLNLFKIHGSVDERTSVILTLRRAGMQLKQEIYDLLKHIFTQCNVLIVGYSGNDDDIFPIFLEMATQTNQIYWALWDQHSLTENIANFGEKCPNCTFIETNKKDVFHTLLTNPSIIEQNLDNLKIITQKQQNQFMQNWIGQVDKYLWWNFVLDLFISIGPSQKEFIQIEKEAQRILRECRDHHILIKSHIICARSLIALKQYNDAIPHIKTAIRQYHSKHKTSELIEVFCLFISQIPISDWSVFDLDPRFYMYWLAGKTYNKYYLGLCNYASGVCYYREEKYELAKDVLCIAIGYSQQCGDSLTEIQCLNVLSEVFRSLKDDTSIQECEKEIKKLEKKTGRSTNMIEERSPILEICADGAKKNYARLMKGEVVLGVIFLSFLTFCTYLLTKTIRSTFFTVLPAILVYIFGKIWNIKKNNYYPEIDK